MFTIAFHKNLLSSREERALFKSTCAKSIDPGGLLQYNNPRAGATRYALDDDPL
jgi:hypothetical protein